MTELTTGQTLFRGQNVTVALHQPSWTMLQRNMSSPIFCKGFKSWTLLVSPAWRMSVLLCSVAAPVISLKICIHSLVFSLSCSLLSSLLWMSWVCPDVSWESCVAVPLFSSLVCSLLCFLFRVFSLVLSCVFSFVFSRVFTLTCSLSRVFSLVDECVLMLLRRAA